MKKSLKLILLLLVSVLAVSACKKKQKPTIYPKSYYTMVSTPFGKANFFTESRSVTSIQVTQGAIWVGTTMGLVQFDHDFSIKQIMTTKEGLPSNAVNALAWHNDTLFAGTDNGLALYSNNTWQNEKLPVKGKITVFSLAEKGGLWIGTDTALFYHAFGRFVTYKTGVKINAIKLAENGAAWVGTANSGLLYCYQGSCKTKPIGLTTVTSMEKIGKTLWIGGVTFDSEYKLKLISDSKTYTYEFENPIDWLQAYKDKVMYYSGGRVFDIVTCIAKSSKGHKLKAEGTAPCYFADINPTKFPPKMNVVHMAKNFLWVGTGSLGVARFDGTQVLYYSSNNLVSKNAKSLSLGCNKTGSKCWFAAGKKSFQYTEQGGFKAIKQLSKEGWYFTRFLLDRSGNTIGIAKNDEGEIGFYKRGTNNSWIPMGNDLTLKTGKQNIYVNFSVFTKSYIAWLGIGSNDSPKGIFVFNFKKNLIYPPKNYKSLKGDLTQIPLSSRKMSITYGHRYLSSKKGIVHLRKVGKKKIITIKGEVDGLNSNVVNDLVIDNEDKLWVATDLGLCQKSSSGFKCGDDSILPESGPIVAFAYDKAKSIMYIASQSELYKVKGGKVTQFAALGNLLNKEIRDMKLDAGGRLWILHPEGLSVLHVDKK
jgi:ligand-binding sensor domain-containing protein